MNRVLPCRWVLRSFVFNFGHPRRALTVVAMPGITTQSFIKLAPRCNLTEPYPNVPADPGLAICAGTIQRTTDVRAALVESMIIIEVVADDVGRELRTTSLFHHTCWKAA